MAIMPLLSYCLPANDGSAGYRLGYIILNFFLISHPPLYAGIRFICPYQDGGTCKPYTLTSTITSICVEHLFWCVTFNTLPLITPHLAVGTLQASIFHISSPAPIKPLHTNPFSTASS